MRHTYILLSLLAGLLFLPTESRSQKPVFELKDIENKRLNYEDVEGESFTVLDFWATWCQPCLRSIPELNKISQDFQKRGVEFVGISIDGPRNQSKLKPFVKSMGVEYTILRDINSEVMVDLNVTVVPTLMIFDKEGELVFFHEGYRPGDEKLIIEKLENLLD